MFVTSMLDRRGAKEVRRDATRWLTVGLGAQLLVSALVIGSAHFLTAWIVATTTLACAALLRKEVAHGWNELSVLFSLLAGWSALQALPLPLSWVRYGAPASAPFWESAMRPLGAGAPAWASLSLDPGASIFEAVRWASYAVLVALACRVVRRRGIHDVAVVVAGVTGVVALVSLAHQLLGAEAVFGVYEPMGGARRLGPMLNPNNLAGYVNLGVFCGLGLLLARHRRIPGPLVAFQIVVCGACCLMSASRGGVVCLILGGALFAWLTRSHRVAESRSPLVLGVTLLVVALGVGWLGLTRLTMLELLDADLRKFEMLSELGPLYREHFWFGLGRGAFDSAGQRYLSDNAASLRSIECFPLAWAAEWGAPVAVAAIAWLAWILKPTPGLIRSNSARGVWIGIVVLFVQNLADLGLEVTGVFNMVCVAAGALVGVKSEAPPSAVGWRGAFLTHAPVILGGALTIPALLGGPDVFTKRHEIARRLGPVSAQAVREELPDLLARYPAESYFRLAGAIAALDSGRDPLPWIAGALERAPRDARVHFIAARSLEFHDARLQGLFHLRQAITFEPTLGPLVVSEVMRWTGEPSLWGRIVPEGPAGADVLLELGRRTPEAQLPRSRRSFFEQAQERSPESLPILMGLADELSADLVSATTPCAPESRCQMLDASAHERRLEQISARIRRLEPRSCMPARLRARILSRRGDLSAASSLLKSACSDCDDALGCSQERALVADRSGDRQELEKAESSYGALGCMDTESCVATETWLARRAAARGDWFRSYERFASAARQAQDSDLWFSAAESAAQASEPVRAQQAVDEAKRLGGKDPRIEALVAAAHSAVLRQMLR